MADLASKLLDYSPILSEHLLALLRLLLIYLLLLLEYVAIVVILLLLMLILRLVCLWLWNGLLKLDKVASDDLVGDLAGTLSILQGIESLLV